MFEWLFDGEWVAWHLCKEGMVVVIGGSGDDYDHAQYAFCIESGEEWDMIEFAYGVKK